MKGFGTDEGRLISVLAGIPDPLVMANLHHTYNAKHRRNLEADIKSETSGYFEEALLALVRGPLRQDVWNLRDALKGVGTKEVVLNDVLCGRRSADIEAIKNECMSLVFTSLLMMMRLFSCLYLRPPHPEFLPFSFTSSKIKRPTRS